MEKKTQIIKSEKEIQYERRVKSVELAIKSQGKPALSSTVVKAAGEIFKYLMS